MTPSPPRTSALVGWAEVVQDFLGRVIGGTEEVGQLGTLGKGEEQHRHSDEHTVGRGDQRDADG